MRIEKRIPTIIGLLLLILGVGVGVILVGQQQIFRLAASPEITPKDVRVANITDTGFSVSWITERETVAFLTYGNSLALGKTVKDDRDVGGNQTARLVHHATLTGLAPNTRYFFKINSDKETFDLKGKAWEQTTAQQLSPRTSDLISGSVKTSTSSPATDIVVYVNLSSASPLSTIANSEGRFSLSLSQARTTDLKSFATYDKNTTVFSVFVQTGKSEVSSAQVLITNARPIPPLVIGQSHDFRKATIPQDSTSPKSTLQLPAGGPIASPSASSTPQPAGSSFNLTPLTSPTPATTSAKLTIDNLSEKEKISTAKPEFRGQGPANTTLTIVVESTAPQTDKVKTDTNGGWKWSPKTSLASGNHKITVSYNDQQGKIQNLVRNFTILASSGGLPAFTSTPSGQIATPSASPTASPKITASPKPATSSARVSLPSTASGIPVSGDLTFTFTIFILGIVTLFGGIVLLKVNPKS